MNAQWDTPCGKCKCCQEGKHCAYVLKLSPRDTADAARVLRVLGIDETTPIRHVNLKPAASIEQARRESAEPMTRGTCRECGGPMHVATYLAEFLKRWGGRWPDCDGCEAKARAA